MRLNLRFFKNLPIQRKINFAILLTCALSLAVAGLAIFVVQLFTFRLSFRRDLDTTGRMIAQNCGATITFKDRKGAEDILSAVQEKPSILRALIETPDGAEFAAYHRWLPGEIQAIPIDDGFHLAGPLMILNRPIVVAGERIGTLRLICDYRSEYYRSLRLYAVILCGVLLVSALLAMALSVRMQRLISRPILALAATAESIAGQKNVSLRAIKVWDDEVGRLTDAFNQMLERLEEQAQKVQKLNRQLMETSRQAGMSEVATGVLHNVGNVLNSVNVSVNLVNEKLAHSQLPNLPKLSEMLRAQGDNIGDFLTQDPRGRKVPEFVAHLAAALGEERTEIVSEIQSLQKNIEHIKEIVSMQQDYARVVGVIEDLPAPALIEDAIRMNEGAFVRHGVTVKKEYSDVPPVRVDKHKVLQILVNLFRNAKYAMDATGRNDKVLTLGVTMNGSGRVKVTVKDNGIGIPSENLKRIFGHGFTTKKEGHGFGLHSGSLAAKEMGGELQAFSDGPGTGSMFVLELPVAAAFSPQNATNHQS